MSEWYTIGLQTGKNVSKRIDKFIELQYCDECKNFNPDAKKTLSDGTSIYQWYMKWNPYIFKDEKELITILQDFDGSDSEDDAYKLVCVGDEGSEDEYGNTIGYDIFIDIYQSHTLSYPEEYEQESEKTHNKELPANIIDIFEDFLDERDVEIDNDEHQGDEGKAIIYGSDFDSLMEKITETLRNHGINVKDSWS